MPAASSSSIQPAVDYLVEAVDHHRVGHGCELLAALTSVSDPGDPRGVQHEFSTILAVAVCAVLAGCRSFHRDRTVGGECIDAGPGRVEGGWGVCLRSRRFAARCATLMAMSSIPQSVGGPPGVPTPVGPGGGLR